MKCKPIKEKKEFCGKIPTFEEYCKSIDRYFKPLEENRKDILVSVTKEAQEWWDKQVKKETK